MKRKDTYRLYSILLSKFNLQLSVCLQLKNGVVSILKLVSIAFYKNMHLVL